MIKKIYNRIYSDYFLGSRLNEYKHILTLAQENEYEFHSIHSFYLEDQKGLDPDKKYFVSRHDIDTDVATAKEMFLIEQALEVKSTFYFRLSTLDYPFMEEINRYGSEASYHFEELATYAKKNKIYYVEALQQLIPEIRKEFLKNIEEIKNNISFPLVTVASHGDFVNRHLKIANYVILDESTKKLAKILLETYDAEAMQNITFRTSDTIYPKFYTTGSIEDAILKNENVIYFLTHPRHWRSNFFINTKDNFIRLYEGLRWKLKI